MNKSVRITLICIISLLILLVIGGTIFGYIQKYAYADYSDLTSNSVINFNQLFNNNTSRGNYNSISISKSIATYSVSGSFTGYTLRLGFNEASPTIPIVSGHIYYLNCNFKINSGNTPIIQMFNSSGSVLTEGYTTKIFTANTSGTYSLGFYVETTKTYNFSVTPMLIDLTQCFGASNEPSLQEAQDFFSADYYNYTTGTPMPYSKDYLKGYLDGMEDLSESISITLNNDIIGNTAYPYNYNGVTSTFSYSSSDNVWLLYGYGAIPIGATITENTITTITTYVWANFSGQKYVFYFYKRNDSDTLVQLGYAPIEDRTTDMIASLTISMPTNIETIYIALSDNVNFSLSSSSLYVYSTSLEFKTPNISAIITNAYDRGYYACTLEYAEDSPKYLEIWQKGFNWATQHNGFNDSWDFVSNAFSGIGGIFALELLPGIPLGTFILVPLMVSLIFFVVKLTKGGS